MTALPLFLKGQALHALGGNMFLDLLTGLRPDRKLILVQLNGGNDGLNTLFPLDQYANLQKARSNIIIPEAKLLDLEDQLGLHPSMEKLRQLYVEEQILFVQNVGYPNPNLSHFRSKDILTSASDSDIVLSSGWLGRMLNEIHPSYPEGYPDENYPHPLALTIGSTNSATCQGETSNLGTVIKNLNISYESGGGGEGSFPDSPFGNELEFVSTVMQQTEVYLSVIKEAADKASNLSELWPKSGDNKLADQLKIVANLIAGGLQTQVYVVNLGGFDTHSAQVVDGSPDTGKHANLLEDLSTALHAFQDDLSLLGLEEDVIGLVFSEFGRRIKSNSSFGCDHGAAWPAILFGSRINPTVLGDNPQISSNVDKKDNLPMQFDFRSLYGSIFAEWFEADPEMIKTVLYKDFDAIPILQSTVSNQNNLSGFVQGSKDISIRRLYPNPANELLNVDFISGGERTLLSIFSTGGQQVQTHAFNDLIAGNHRIELSVSDIPEGNYHLILQSGTNRKSSSFSIVR